MIENPHSSNSFNMGGPFGDSDAAKVDFSSLKRGLISFTNSIELVDSDDFVDISTRVIFGKKGAGKTLYLKLIQDSCRQNNNDKTGAIYFTDIDNIPPSSMSIIRVTDWFYDHKGIAEEIWMKLWYVSILRTIYCHVFNKEVFKKYLDKNLKVSFVSRYEELVPALSVPISLYRQLENIINKFNSSKDLQTFLNNEKWSGFEAEIGELLNDLPPLYFFIDGLDENYVNAPHHWLICQYGLFNCVFRMLRSQLIGSRLHVVVCLREFVYAYVLHTINGSRFLAESKIKVLKWNKPMLKAFFDKKVEMLNDKYFIDPTRNKNIENLVGAKKIYNKRHNAYEDIYEYIFRHTMLMPRDIINIGNLFCNNLTVYNESVDLQKTLKESVHQGAIQIANEQLTVAALLINTQWIYKGAAEHNNIDSYTDPEVLEITRENLKTLIMKINKDRFTIAELLEGQEELNRLGFKDDYPFVALFQCGLLGFITQDFDGNDQISFFSELRAAEFKLPTANVKFVFHSCLIDYLNIKPIGDPIYV